MKHCCKYRPYSSSVASLGFDILAVRKKRADLYWESSRFASLSRSFSKQIQPYFSKYHDLLSLS